MMSPERSSYHQKNLSVFNLLAYIIVIVLNVLSATGRINGRTPAMIAAQYPTFFTPANFTFLIWALIYFALLGFCIYQCWLAFQPDREEARHHMAIRLQHWWLVSCIANAGWLVSWHYNWIPLSVAVMAFLWFSIWNIQQRFQVAAPEAPLAIKVFVFIPFGLYLGWMSIAFIANMAVAIVYMKIPAHGWLPVLATVGALLVDAGLTGYFLLLHNNVPYALVSIWAFIGIIAQRLLEGTSGSTVIIQTCVVLIGLTLAAVIWQFFRQRHWRNAAAH